MRHINDGKRNWMPEYINKELKFWYFNFNIKTILPFILQGITSDRSPLKLPPDLHNQPPDTKKLSLTPHNLPFSLT
jgi:hypothetical protein